MARQSYVPDGNPNIAAGYCYWFAPTSTVGMASTSPINNLRLNPNGYETP